MTELQEEIIAWLAEIRRMLTRALGRARPDGGMLLTWLKMRDVDKDAKADAAEHAGC